MEAERYTVKYCADQLLLQPDCPVHVKKMQCTRDNLTGSLLLQIRYVNRDARIVESLVIRVSLLDINGQEVASIRALPVTGLHARQHQCFGDNKTVILPRESCDIRVLVDQVQFSDGYLWRNKPENKPIQISPPVKVCGKVQPSRHDGYWYCACGMVNPDSAGECGYCGAPSPLAPAPAPEPAPPAAAAPVYSPAPPVPAAVSSAPVYTAPPAPEPECYVFPTPPIDATGYLPVSPLTEEPDVQDEPQEFPVMDQQEPETHKSHKAVWITLILLLLAGIAAAAYFFGYPLYRYYRASQFQIQGDYASAIAAYEALGDYDDAQAQIAECKFRMAEETLHNGDYAGAYNAFLALPDDDRTPGMLLECLRLMCSDAMKQGNAELLSDYLASAQPYLPAQPPTWYTDAVGWYDYQQGVREFDEGNYDAAIDSFAASVYDDYEEQISACRYAKAEELLQNKHYDEAVDAFAELGNYSDSHTRMLDAMREYVLANYNIDDARTLEYLQTLMDEDVSDAQKLYDELYAWAVDFTCGDGSLSSLSGGTLKDLSALAISYTVVSGHMDGSLLNLTLEYTLPNGKSGTLVFASKLQVGDSGVFRWSENSTVTDKTDGILQLVIRETGTEEILFRKQITIQH